MPEHTGAPDAHPAAARLREFLDDRLPADEAGRVAAHVEDCLRCQRALEDAEPRVALPVAAAGPEWDERRMRRAVRRTLLRTVFDALSILVVSLIVIAALGGFVVSPLLVDRGDRVDRVRMATHDLPILLTPGAVPTSRGHGVGLASHSVEASFVRYVGSEGQELGSFESRLGVLRWRPEGGAISPGLLMREGHVTLRPFEPDRLPEGTVASVQLGFGDGIGHEEADALADGHEEVTLQWVGFRIPHMRPDDVGVGWLAEFELGYSACQQPDRGLDRAPQARIAWDSAGSAHALEQVRRATANLAASRDVRRHLEGTAMPVLQQIEDVAEWLADNEPRVAAAVLTGPTEELAEIVADAGADEATQLGVDLYNGPGSFCG